MRWSDLDWSGVSALFSDVDETLIQDKSMLTFVEVYRSMHPQLYLAPIAEELQALAAAGGQREDANQHYYEAFAGHRLEDLRRAGDAWFERGAADAAFWIQPAAALVADATAEGVPVVAVSGSHRACVEPVARALGIRHVLCTEVETGDDGRLTGHRSRLAIGAAKQERVLAFAEEHEVDLTRAIAMGDHDSDLPFMILAGAAVAVNPSPRLRVEAERRGWPILTG